MHDGTLGCLCSSSCCSAPKRSLSQDDDEENLCTKQVRDYCFVNKYFFKFAFLKIIIEDKNQI